MPTGKRILLGVTGSIAAFKAVELTRELVRRGAEVQVVMTEAAARFVAPFARPITRLLAAIGPASPLAVPCGSAAALFGERLALQTRN